MKSVKLFDDDEEDDGSPEFYDAGDHRKEEEIVKNGRYNVHDMNTLPYLATHWPWEGDRQTERECRTLLAACRFGLARVHLVVWAILVHGNRGANGTIRYVAWDGRQYVVTPRPVDENGKPMRRMDEAGCPSYRDLEAQYGVFRCTLERAYEDLVEKVLSYTRNGAYGKIDRVLQNRMAHDLGVHPQPADQGDWLEGLWWSLGDLSATLRRRCPTTRIGRDAVRSIAYQLLRDGRVPTPLAKSFRMPTYQTAEKLADEYAAVETVVGRDSLNRIMAMLSETLS